MFNYVQLTRSQISTPLNKGLLSKPAPTPARSAVAVMPVATVFVDTVPLAPFAEFCTNAVGGTLSPPPAATL